MQKEVKDRINKRKIAYIYLLHRMFEGNPAMMLRIMRIPETTVADIQDWNTDWQDAVRKTIEEEDAKGVVLRDADGDVPSIRSIKDKLLKRCDSLIQETTDPSKLATVYKILSEFEVTDEKKEKTVLDAINESIKPLSQKKRKDTMTMLEKMKISKQNQPQISDEEEFERDNINEE
jgi:hypothetical protein